MLKPRFNWHCDTAGCCVFAGGTEDYDIYMGECHKHPWDPGVSSWLSMACATSSRTKSPSPNTSKE